MSSQSVSVSNDSVEDEPQLSQQEEPEEIVVRVPEPVEHERNEAEDGGGSQGSSGAGAISHTSGIMEPAPPTYEEALTLFVRDENARNGSQSARMPQPAKAADLRGNGSSNSNATLPTASGRRPSPRSSISEDHEMVARVQQEEMDRIQQRRERSASLSTASSSGEEEGNNRARRNERSRWSVSSAPAGDIRPAVHHHRSHHGNNAGNNRQPSRGRLGTIPEDEEMVIVAAGSGGTNNQPTSSSPSRRYSGRACCYSMCFGFSLFSDKLHPILRRAWLEGFSHMVKTALPVYSTSWRYFFYSVQLLVLTACLILSFASSPITGENIVRHASLGACLLVNVMERCLAWCGCCMTSKKKTYHKFSDVTRNILTDLTLYPAVVASITNTLKTRSYNVVISLWNESVYANVTNTNLARRDDAINLGLNLTVILLFIVMVHLLRVWGVGLVSWRLLREFKKNVSAARTSARTFLVLFFFQVLLMSIVQLDYFVLLGYRVHLEMGASVQPQVLGVSIYLLIMMISGGLLPLFSISMFFLTTQKWAEEFPIAFFLDGVHSQPIFSSQVTDHRIEHKFKRLHDTNAQCSGCLFALVHPLASPLQLIVTMSFFALWVLFAFTYPISFLGSSGLELLLSNTAHGIAGVICLAIVYGITVILSFLTNILPLLYGFLGFAMLPFWGLFYTFLTCSALCCHKS